MMILRPNYVHTQLQLYVEVSFVYRSIPGDSQLRIHMVSVVDGNKSFYITLIGFYVLPDS